MLFHRHHEPEELDMQCFLLGADMMTKTVKIYIQEGW